jgi:L-cystine uptake protein TcyP (sodium:dicarboxylate symporter family)
MVTTLVAAAIGILMAKLFGLSAVGLTASAAESRAASTCKASSRPRRRSRCRACC